MDAIPVWIGEDLHPSLAWELSANDLHINGRIADVASAFLRRDVFHGRGTDGDYRAQAWHTTLEGWLASRPDIEALNRGYLCRYTNKLQALRMARDAGLAVPATTVTNAIDTLRNAPEARNSVAKPVPGGGYCQGIDELLADLEIRNGVAASPAIVQPRLPGADVRIYAIRQVFAGFRIRSEAVDYRASKQREIAPLERLPGSALEALQRLMTRMDLDWCAADFKECPQSGTLTFLEINSNPMFSAFDQVGGGIIARAIVAALSSGDR